LAPRASAQLSTNSLKLKRKFGAIAVSLQPSQHLQGRLWTGDERERHIPRFGGSLDFYNNRCLRFIYFLSILDDDRLSLGPSSQKLGKPPFSSSTRQAPRLKTIKEIKRRESNIARGSKRQGAARKPGRPVILSLYGSSGHRCSIATIGNAGLRTFSFLYSTGRAAPVISCTPTRKAMVPDARRGARKRRAQG